MKKIYFLFLFSLISSFGFSQIVVKTNATVPGLLTVKMHNSLVPDNKDFLTNQMIGLNAADLSVLWEFSSKDEKDFHWFLGLDGGYCVEGMPLNIECGVNYKIAEFPKLRIEIQGEIKTGPMVHTNGGVFLFNEVSFDLIFMHPNRKHFFGGIGICDDMYCYVEFYKVREPLYCIGNLCGLEFSVGYRF